MFLLAPFFSPILTPFFSPCLSVFLPPLIPPIHIYTSLLQCCVGIVYAETTMASASGRTSSKKWWAKEMADSIGHETLVSAATIMTKHKPTVEDCILMEEAETKGEPAPKKRQTTTEALWKIIPESVKILIPSDEQALAYVQNYPLVIKRSTTLMARYASYGPKTKEAIDALLVEPPIPPQGTIG